MLSGSVRTQNVSDLLVVNCLLLFDDFCSVFSLHKVPSVIEPAVLQ